MANDFSGDADCIGWWKFESADPLVDSMGIQANLTNNNTVGTSADCQQGTASADFEKDSSECYTIADASLSSTFPGKSGQTNTVFTCCFWMKAESSHTSFPVCKYDNVNNKRSWGLMYYGADQDFYYINGYNSGGSDEQVGPHSGNFASGTWYHIAFVHAQPATTIFGSASRNLGIHGATAAGVTVGTDYKTTFAQTMSADDGGFSIGAKPTTGDPYDGLIDEVVIFKRVLTLAEIDSIRAGTYVVASGGRTTKNTRAWPLGVAHGMGLEMGAGRS